MISGYFDPNFAGPLPMVRVEFFLPRITSDWVSVDFLLDTGADVTALHPQDALFRVGIDAGALSRPDVWPKRLSAGGVGGTGEYYVQPAHYLFRHDDGHPRVVREEIYIARPSPENAALESLLGWDVLQHFKISLDWAARRITLQ